MAQPPAMFQLADLPERQPVVDWHFGSEMVRFCTLFWLFWGAKKET
jgi:hypothetical protein